MFFCSLSFRSIFMHYITFRNPESPLEGLFYVWPRLWTLKKHPRQFGSSCRWSFSTLPTCKYLVSHVKEKNRRPRNGATDANSPETKPRFYTSLNYSFNLSQKLNLNQLVRNFLVNTRRCSPSAPIGGRGHLSA